MLALLNDALQERKLDSQYVVMLFAVWNDENRTLQVANSGAVQPILLPLRRNRPRCAPRASRWACSPMSPTRSSTSPPSPATPSSLSRTAFWTPKTRKDEMYGEERLSGLLCAHRGQSAQEIADAILADVTRFQDGKDRFDDETIIVLRVR